MPIINYTTSVPYSTGVVQQGNHERMLFMDYAFLIGRILFSFIFISSGLNHLKNFSKTVEAVKKFNVPLPALSAAVTSLFALVGGLSVALGFYSDIGALLIFLFLAPATFMAHRFWGLPDEHLKEIHLAHFFKNLALMGAALIIMYVGSGPLSLH